MRDLVFYVLRSSKIQLEAPLKAKGIAFPLTAEWHWFSVFFFSRLCCNPCKGTVYFQSCTWMLQVDLWKNLFLSTSHIQYLCESLCYSTLSWFIVSVLQHGLIHGSVLDGLPDSFFWFVLWCTFLLFCCALTSPCRLCILIVISTTLYLLSFFYLSCSLKQ